MESSSSLKSEQSECEICLDSLEESISFHLSRPCRFRCCRSCASTFIEGKIKDHQLSNLQCPSLICDQQIKVDDLKRIITLTQRDNETKKQSLLKAFDEVYKEEMVIQEARDRRLYASFPKKVKNFVSDQVDVMKLSMWRASKDSKRCPGCRMVIEKIGGCRHMTCRSCNHQFYWCCLQNYKHPHNEFICAPMKILNNQNPLWGPVMPIRCVTKTAAVCATPVILIGVGAVVVVIALPVGGAVFVGSRVSRKYDQWKHPPGQEAEQLKMKMEETNLAIRRKFHPHEPVIPVLTETPEPLPTKTTNSKAYSN
jgi:hypothetical protein